jgi:hypothetical protein
MAKMPETLKARFTVHLTRRRSWSFSAPVARMRVGSPQSRVLDGQAIASVPVHITPSRWLGAVAVALRVVAPLLRILRVRVDVKT